MLTQSKGKIFLSEQRGVMELDWFRSCHTFNFGQYYSEHKTPFGGLYVLNDDTIAGGRTISMTVETDSDIILLPVVGSIAYKDCAGQTGTVVAGQAQLIKAQKGMSYELTNPYGSELVRLIQIWLRNPGSRAHAAPRLFSFDPETEKNRLIEVFSPLPGLLSGAFAPAGRHTGEKDALPVMLIGKFDGREDAAYQMLDSGRGMFAFVLEGVFEVQYRLMQPGDGLALWGVEEIKLEALSNDAIILMIEVPLD